MTVLHARQRAALEQAAGWFGLLQCEEASVADQAGWQAWLERDEYNRWAWAQVEQLQQRLHDMPTNVTGRALRLAEQPALGSRRSILKGFAMMVGTGALGYTTYRQGQRAGWMADYHTRTGERLDTVLADGSRLQLNTDSAVDVLYSATQRRIQLHKGELLLNSAVDPARRPLLVQTAQGSIQALGTRFAVRAEADSTLVSVFEHQVRINPSGAAPLVLDAGTQCRFSANQLGAVQQVNAGQDAWSQGMLVANDQRLDAFVAELSRYRPGWLRCDPAVGGLRISGAFATDDSDQTLRALSTALPVRVVQTTRYWVTVVAL
ncbi:FecR domain-containing protein [Pseudomonas shirazensis]|uniref:FecR domain-containing protein n=1 Tax=Pseudomonas shirazensis TaxID=2745494 RepID=UPI003D289C19